MLASFPGRYSAWLGNEASGDVCERWSTACKVCLVMLASFPGRYSAWLGNEASGDVCEMVHCLQGVSGDVSLIPRTVLHPP